MGKCTINSKLGGNIEPLELKIITQEDTTEEGYNSVYTKEEKQNYLEMLYKIEKEQNKKNYGNIYMITKFHLINVHICLSI